MLHWFMCPDPHPDPHDHPVSFLSLTVRGSYLEWRPQGSRRQRLKLIRATDLHRITEADPGTVTLVLNGPNTRVWGYQTPDGWVDWRTYRAEHGG